MSAKFTYDSEDIKKIAKTAAFSVASVIIVAAINALPHVQIPTDYMWVVPVVNTLLVAAKKWTDGER
jgi:hypothetical protein